MSLANFALPWGRQQGSTCAVEKVRAGLLLTAAGIEENYVARIVWEPEMQVEVGGRKVEGYCLRVDIGLGDAQVYEWSKWT